MEMMTVEKIGDEITNVVFSGRLDSIGAASVSRHFDAEVSDKRAVIVDLSDVDPEMARRLASYVTGARLGREARPDPMNIDVAHDPMRRQVKVVLVGVPVMA